MSVIDPGGTTRRTRAARPARRVKPNDRDERANGRKRKQRKPAPPKERLLGPADILASDHPLHGAMVGWLQAKSRKLGLDNALPVTKRQARRFLQAHPQYRGVMVEIKAA